MFRSKKGVSEVITTVLMVVLVVAAIGILGVVVLNLVRENTANIGEEANCLTISMNIESALINQSASSKVLTVRVKRTSNDENISALNFFVDGQKTAMMPTRVPLLGETVVYNVTLADANVVGKNIEVGAVVGSRSCAIADTEAIVNGTV